MLISLSPLMGQSDRESIVSKQIKDVANSENIPNEELEKAYIAYRSAYYYGKEFDFEGSNSFGEVAEKQAKIISKLRYARNEKLSDAAYKVLEKYEDLEFTRDNKSDYTDDCYDIAEGLKAAME